MNKITISTEGYKISVENVAPKVIQESEESLLASIESTEKELATSYESYNKTNNIPENARKMSVEMVTEGYGTIILHGVISLFKVAIDKMIEFVKKIINYITSFFQSKVFELKAKGLLAKINNGKLDIAKKIKNSKFEIDSNLKYEDLVKESKKYEDFLKKISPHLDELSITSARSSKLLKYPGATTADYPEIFKALNDFEIEKNIEESRKMSVSEFLGDTDIVKTLKDISSGTFKQLVELKRVKTMSSMYLKVLIDSEKLETKLNLKESKYDNEKQKEVKRLLDASLSACNRLSKDINYAVKINVNCTKKFLESVNAVISEKQE